MDALLRTMTQAPSAAISLVARQRRLGRRRARADLAVGRCSGWRWPPARSGARAQARARCALHEHLALTALAAIAVHGLALLGDHWLKPGWRGITIPFELSYRPGVHRARHHRRLSRRSARAELLPAPPDRRATLAKAAPGNGDRLDAVGRPRTGRGLGRRQAVAARDRADARRADRLPARRAHAFGADRERPTSKQAEPVRRHTAGRARQLDQPEVAC